jgi:beta-lactamase regulating signal transducer with metallopeptidase domain
MTSAERTGMTWRAWTVVLVWLLAVVGAVLVGVLSPRPDHYVWLGVVLAGLVILTFAIQLSTQKIDGFVSRAVASIGVSVVVLAIAAGILAFI